MLEKVLTKQLATAATRKCSGVQRAGSPKNAGGALKEIERKNACDKLLSVGELEA